MSDRSEDDDGSEFYDYDSDGPVVEEVSNRLNSKAALTH